MSLIELLALMLVACAGYLVWSNLKARETANAAIREACKAEGMLLLNDTVGLESMWFARDGSGRLRLRRVYGFEYSDDGVDRRRGSVTMFDDVISIVNVGARARPESESLH